MGSPKLSTVLSITLALPFTESKPHTNDGRQQDKRERECDLTSGIDWSTNSTTVTLEKSLKSL